MRNTLLILAAAAALLSPAVDAANVRSTKVKNAFVAQQACPSTAQNKLPCPGFVIDDKVALDCGGTDVVANKQWLTVAAGKLKDKTERDGPTCAHRTHVKVPA